MRNTILLSLASLAGVCLVSSSGCSSSSGNTSPDTDSGTGFETSSGSGSGSSSGASGSGSGSSSGASSGSGSGGLPGTDASSDTGGNETGMACTAMPQGTQILASATAAVVGITSDDNVLYYDSTALSLSAVPVAGGPPTTIGAFNGTQDPLFVDGSVAAFFTGLTQQNAPFYGPLTVWTHAGGKKTVSTSSYYGAPGGGAFDISKDGSLVLYTDNANPTSADIWVAGTDGSNPTKLVTGAVWNQSCSPVLSFVGSYAVVAYCGGQADASTTLATIAAYGPAPTWGTVQTLATSASPFFGNNSAGTMISYGSSSGLYVEAVTGGTPTLIDANGTSGLFTNDGMSILYFDKSSNLWRSPIATPAPAQLTMNKQWLFTLALSSDDKWLELASGQDPNTGYTDMYLVSTTPQDGGSPVTTLTSTQNGANFYDAFTADNSQALFFAPIDQNGVAPFLNLPLPPSGAAATVSMTGWEEFVTSGTKLVYSDNWVTGGSSGYADIKGVDVATNAAPTTLVSGADANFFVSNDKKTVVYSWNYCSGVTGGIYTIAAP